MQLEALKIFCDVVRWASFSRGAVENGISQSSASQAVHNLEERLGVKLIDRSKRPLVATEHGRIYYEGCKDLISRYYEIEDRIRSLDHAENVTGVVRVAAIYSVGLHHMTLHIERFHQCFPSAECRLECQHPSRVVESVRDETAELGIVSFPRKWSDLTVDPWREEEMMVAVPPGHPLATLEGVEVARLDGEKFIHFDPDLAIRRAIDRFLKRCGVQVETTLEFDNVENIKRAVEEGVGLAILPGPSLEREIQSGSLLAVRLKDRRLTRPLAIIHRGASALGVAASRFLELMRTEEPSAKASAPLSALRAAEPVVVGPPP
ncbi:LysR family transcriptional regulator [soil metagenome]